MAQIVATRFPNVAVASGEAEACWQRHFFPARCPRTRLRLRLVIWTSDVQLTSGTGPAAVATTRDRLGMSPVLFISGNPADCGPMSAQDDVFSKPFDRAHLAQAFRKILSEHVPWKAGPTDANGSRAMPEGVARHCSCGGVR